MGQGLVCAMSSPLSLLPAFLLPRQPASLRFPPVFHLHRPPVFLLRNSLRFPPFRGNPGVLSPINRFFLSKIPSEKIRLLIHRGRASSSRIVKRSRSQGKGDKAFQAAQRAAIILLDMIQQVQWVDHLEAGHRSSANGNNFNSEEPLTKGETIQVVESLLSMHGVGISKIFDKFYKAVGAAKINMHVPIWLEGPASVFEPSQKIYMKLFKLNYAQAKDIVTHLSPFKTEVGQLVVLENANSILATDALLNLQRMEKLENMDSAISTEELGTKFFVWPTKHAGARELESKMKTMIEGSLKPFLGGTTQVDSDERTGKLIIVTKR